MIGAVTHGVAIDFWHVGGRVAGTIGAAAATAAPAWRSPLPYCSFGIGSPGLSRSGFAVLRRMLPTWSAVRAALRERTSAATPATWGEAMEVPLSDAYVSSQ